MPLHHPPSHGPLDLCHSSWSTRVPGTATATGKPDAPGTATPPLPRGAQSKPLPRPLSRVDRATWRELKAESPTPSPAPVAAGYWARRWVPRGAVRPFLLTRGTPAWPSREGHRAPWRQPSVVCRCWGFRGALGAVGPRALRGAPGHCSVTTRSGGVGVLATSPGVWRPQVSSFLSPTPAWPDRDVPAPPSSSPGSPAPRCRCSSRWQVCVLGAPPVPSGHSRHSRFL